MALWSSKRGSWNFQIGLDWTGIEVSSDGSQARIVSGKLLRNSSAQLNDITSTTTGTGTAIVDFTANGLNYSGTGKKTVRSVAGQWVNLSYTIKVKASVTITAGPIEGAGGNVTVSGDIEYPLRKIGLPSAPTGLAVSGTGSSRTLTWTNTAPTDPAKPYTGISVRRRVNGGAWAVIANPGVVTTFTNTGLGENVQVEYQVAGRNSAGTGPWSVASAPSWTTPRTPTIGTAEKNSAGAIVVSATNQAPYATLLRFQDSPDGAAWTDVGTLAMTGLGVKTWPHSSPNPSITHRYRVRAERGALVSGWSGTTNIVALQAKPNPPTILGPVAAADPADDILLSYRHNPVDTTPQTQREIRYETSTDGGMTWSGWTSFGQESTDIQSRTVAGGTWGVCMLRWQVRTRGAHVDWSDWSAASTVVLTSRPVAGILDPGVTENTSIIAGRVSYFDPEGLAQSGTRMTVRIPGGMDLETVQAFGSDPLPPFNMRFADASVYEFTATTTNAAGLTSDPVTVSTTITYLPPEVPEAVLTWDQTRAELTFATTNPAGSDREPLTGRNIALMGDSWIEGMGYTSDWGATVGTVLARSVMAEPRRMWIPATTDGQCVFETSDRPYPQDWTYNRVPRSYFVPATESTTFPLPAGITRVRVWVSRDDGTGFTGTGSSVTVVPGAGTPVILTGAQTDPSGYLTEMIQVDNPGDSVTVTFSHKGQMYGVEAWEGDPATPGNGLFAFGVTGQNSADWADSVHRWGRLQRLMVGLDIDTVVIEIMINDKFQDVDIPTYSANIQEGIEHILDYLPGVHLVGIRMPDAGFHDLSAYNAALALLVDEMVDCTSLPLDGSTVGADGTHLLDEGNRQLAGLLREGLNPPTGGTTTDTVYQQLWRVNPDGTETLVADQIPPNGVVSDSTPYTIGGTYRLVAVSAEGATADAVLTATADPAVAQSWWLNVGDQVTSITYRPNRDRRSSLAQTAEHYAGRRDPVVTYGEATKRDINLSGTLMLDEDNDWSVLEAMALTPTPAILRGPDGTRALVAIPDTSAQDSDRFRQDVSLSFVRLGDEPELPALELV